MNVQTNFSSGFGIKKKSPFSSFLDRFSNKKKALSSKKFLNGLFLVLLILGLISVGILINLQSDLRQQAATDAYDQCLYWSGGSCPNGYVASTNCYPACSTGGACCKAVAPTSVPVVTPTPTPVEESPCLNFDKKTGLCSGFAYGT